MNLFSVLGDLVSERVEYSLKQAVRPLPGYIRKLATGAIVAIISAGGFLLTIIFLVLALFFTIADYHQLENAALWSSLAAFLVSVGLAIVGFSLIRRPR